LRHLLSAVVLIALAGVVVPARPASAAVTNTVVLDNGTCGHDLQLGSDPTASSSATPTFLLYADGGAASYSVAIDGTSIGTFHGNGYGDACITDALVLSNGPHVLTANELAPHAGNPVTPFSFTVDTVPPSVPSQPSLDPGTDSGVKGDDITNVTSPLLDGTSDPSVSISVYDGTELVGGARADSSGHWQVSVIPLASGVHSLTARAMSEAGTLSSASPALLLTIDTTPPPAPPAPTLDPASDVPPTGDDTTTVTTPTIDGVGVGAGSIITIDLDGTDVGTTEASSSGSWQFVLPAMSLGSHSVAATATDVAGNTSPPSATLDLDIITGSVSDPAAPALSATVGSASVALSWTTPADGGTAITGYNIYRGTASGSETLLISVGSATTTYTDAAVRKATMYHYRITATNSVGESVRSNEVSAKMRRHRNGGR
jgi:hypothetical protein